MTLLKVGISSVLEGCTDECKPAHESWFCSFKVLDAHRFVGEFLHHQSLAVAQLRAVCFW